MKITVTPKQADEYPLTWADIEKVPGLYASDYANNATVLISDKLTGGERVAAYFYPGEIVMPCFDVKRSRFKKFTGTLTLSNG